MLGCAAPNDGKERGVDPGEGNGGGTEADCAFSVLRFSALTECANLAQKGFGGRRALWHAETRVRGLVSGMPKFASVYPESDF